MNKKKQSETVKQPVAMKQPVAVPWGNLWLPLVKVFLIAVNIGLYVSLSSLVAVAQGWSTTVYALIPMTAGAASIAAYGLLCRTAARTFSRRFYLLFGLGMALCVSGAFWFGEHLLFWLVFSAMAGVAHTHFYHGIRLRITHGAPDGTLMRIFSLKYIVLCLGSVLGVGLAGLTTSHHILLAVYALCYLGIAAVGTLPEKYQGKSRPAAPPPTTLKHILRAIRLAPVPVLFCALGGVVGETLYFFTVKLHLDAGFSRLFSLQTYNLLLLGAVVLQYPLAYMQDIIPRRSIFLFAVLAAGLFALWGFSSSMFLMTGALLALGGLIAALAVVGDGRLCAAHKENRSTALQTGAFFYLAGDTLIHPVVGAVADAWGRPGVAVFFMAVLALMLAFLPALLRGRSS